MTDYRVKQTSPEITALVSGAHSGIAFPQDIATLGHAGPEFLTRAFRASGVLDPDNEVVAIRELAPFVGGGGGPKARLDVTYKRPQPGLPEALFAKFQMPIGHPLRDIFAGMMEPEIRFALLSQRTDFPIRVPICAFADNDPATACALLITERVPYGEGGIEPALDKCLDYLMTDPADHYRAMTRSLGRLAGFHRAGGFGGAVERQFPFDPERENRVQLIGDSAESLAAKIERLRAFSRDYPRLMPDPVYAPGFFDAFARDAEILRANEGRVHAHLNGQSELIALCHWNMNIDNGWFWRDAGGTMQCGLLDWGSTAQMNIAHSFFGMICGGEAEFNAHYETELMRLLLAEYAAHGGPQVALDVLRRSVQLVNAIKGVAWMLDAPASAIASIPDLADIPGRRDARIVDNFTARVQLNFLATFLQNWARLDYGALVRGFA